MISRQELEEIMNDKPHGWRPPGLRKGAKPFTFKAWPYKRVQLIDDMLEVTVYAKTSSMALQEARTKVWCELKAKELDFTDFKLREVE